MSNTVFINWDAVEEELGRVFDQAELVAKSGLNARTVAKTYRRRESIRRKKAHDLLRVLGMKNPESFLSVDNVWKSKASGLAGSFLADWDLCEKEVEVENVRDMSYRILKAVHRETGRVGRAKIFHLRNYDDETLEFVKKELQRNPKICAMLERNGHFPLLYQCGFSEDDRYWAIERWEDARTLKEVVKADELDQAEVPRVARELAKALKSLHDAGVVYRCLTPRNICLREDGSLFVRDFELSTFARTTKSRDIGEDRVVFYAPEYDSEDIDFRADMYSWAQIVIYCLTRKQPPSHCSDKFLATLPVEDKGTFRTLQACCDLNPDFRKLERKSVDGKSNFADLLDQISGWGF